ncbi:hypothetical protein FUA48_11255 [Flavobacterium alkalisoli]|uniref:Uncharacterized protein n=1 Tax=Flavobacterium alkalisoli TaxID=2602769 RepID=A0A5B9FZE5_9FLAO|nr:hypothetical protein [Flavobacterium alkalisoli]QEE50137.1 hypothetical protein FUA48_11255 [Flavobacterium alkalisoli]
MHINNNITHEIVELSEIKKAYNHYLSSYEAQQDIENYTYIVENRNTLSIHLRELYTKLAIQQQAQKALNQNVRYTKYAPCPLEKSAILHFNSDNRFSITE